MNRVEEIAQAMKSLSNPVFLYGLVALARHDYEGVMSDLAAADKLILAEQIDDGVRESVQTIAFRARLLDAARIAARRILASEEGPCEDVGSVVEG